MNRPIRLLAAVAALALVAGACGDDDDEDTTATTEAPAAETTAADADTTAAGDTTAAPDTTAGGDTTEASTAESVDLSDVDLSGQSLTIGSADFSESILLAEIYGGALGAKGADISLQTNIGNREAYYGAIAGGEVDLVPEYTNSLLSYVLRQADPNAAPDAATVDEQVSALGEALPDNLTVLTPSTAEDKDVIVCNQQTADQYSLTDLSSLAEVSGEIILGAPPEFETRSPFGLVGFQELYGAEFKEFVPLAIGPPIVDALTANAINCGNLFSTDAVIAENEFVALEDDQEIVPLEAVLPLINVEKATPEVTAVLDAVSAAITTETLLELNAQVQSEGLAESEVAAQWLEDNGFSG